MSGKKAICFFSHVSNLKTVVLIAIVLCLVRCEWEWLLGRAGFDHGRLAFHAKQRIRVGCTICSLRLL